MSDKKKIIRIDENHILTYSALAAAFVAGSNARGAVDITDIADETVTNTTFGIDFNDDATDDFDIYHNGSIAAVKEKTASGEVVWKNIAITAAYALNSGDLIAQTLSKGQWGGIATKWLGSGNSFMFPGQGDRYVGVKFKIGGNTHYGWILLNVPALTPNVLVKKFAYETTADLGINAGFETSLPVVLSEFKGFQEGKTVVVNWSTDSEIENIGFILERRESGPSGASGSDWQQIAHFDSDPELQGQGSKVTRTDYSFVDKNVEIGKRYSYRLTDVSYQVMYKGISRIIQDVEVNPLIASSFKLHPNYPNPFNPETTLGFTLDEPGNVQLSVYNLKGQLVTSLLNEERTGGFHEVNWNASEMDAGVYFVELISGAQRQMQKITLVK